MKSRERGNVWPVISVAAGAFFVLVIVPLILQRQTNARMATVDPQVTIGDAGPESCDVTAIAIAAVTCVTEGTIQGRTPRDVGEIISAIAQRQLVPSEWITNQPGVLQMPHGTVHLRYSPIDLLIETISVPNDRGDGPAILIRIPDRENTTVGARYFESMQLDGIIYPNPFVPISDIIASGWQPRLFKQTQISDDQRAQLENWVPTVSRK